MVTDGPSLSGPVARAIAAAGVPSPPQLSASAPTISGIFVVTVPLSASDRPSQVAARVAGVLSLASLAASGIGSSQLVSLTAGAFTTQGVPPTPPPRAPRSPRSPPPPPDAPSPPPRPPLLRLAAALVVSPCAGLPCWRGDVPPSDRAAGCRGATASEKLLISAENLLAGFVCQPCPAGFMGDGATCLDVDECAQGPCRDGRECTNTIGSFQCGAWPTRIRHCIRVVNVRTRQAA